jgi:hypothetical protein
MGGDGIQKSAYIPHLSYQGWPIFFASATAGDSVGLQPKRARGAVVAMEMSAKANGVTTPGNPERLSSCWTRKVKMFIPSEISLFVASLDSLEFPKCPQTERSAKERGNAASASRSP